MSGLTVSLFGNFSISGNEPSRNMFDVLKIQELFSYLLLHHDRPHPREVLADLLWATSPTQSKNYLRKALWQLQTSLETIGFPPHHTLLVDNNCVQLVLKPDLWVDVVVFEAAYNRFRGISGCQLDILGATELGAAATLYRSDLLEGWYHEWCLYERERLQQLYLLMVDKLIAYYETHGDYEIGVSYATEIFRYDKAREQTHRSLMRLYYLAGDRTGALRQFERCQAVLNEELGVAPAARTVALFEQIRADHLLETSDTNPLSSSLQENPSTSIPSLPTILQGLKQLQANLHDVQYQVQSDIDWVERQLQARPH